MGKHSEWRKTAKKLRRKRIRQKIAIEKYAKECEEQKRRELSPTYQEWLQKQREEEQFHAQEEERIMKENEANWLRIEEEARKQWLELQKKLELVRQEREKQRALIKMEWEKEQKRLKAIKEQKEKELEEKVQRQQQLLDQIENYLANEGETPERLKEDIETNPGKPPCPFFHKTSACRFGDKCSRNHIKPLISCTLLIPNFYSHYSLEQNENEYGNDSALEFENDETYSHFKEFFYDVLPEMERCGIIRQFKVCCNREIHLRGNVYVEYNTKREAMRSYQMFNGRWYGGKQLSVEFCRIESWKSAICGLYFKKKCPKGSACNFLHVFQNPNNLFWDADRDRRPRSPSNGISWSWSESPDENEGSDWEDRFNNKSKRENGDHNKRYKQRRKKRSRTRSPNRKRSRSPSRKRSRSRSGSRRHKSKKSRR